MTRGPVGWQVLLDRLHTRGEHRAAFRQVGLKGWYGLGWALLATSSWDTAPAGVESPTAAAAAAAAAVATSLPLAGMRLMLALEESNPAAYLTDGTLAPLQVGLNICYLIIRR